MIRNALDFLGKEADNTYLVAGASLPLAGEIFAHTIALVSVLVLIIVMVDHTQRSVRRRHARKCTAPSGTEVTQVTACYCEQTQYV